MREAQIAAIKGIVIAVADLGVIHTMTRCAALLKTVWLWFGQRELLGKLDRVLGWLSPIIFSTLHLRMDERPAQWREFPVSPGRAYLLKV